VSKIIRFRKLYFHRIRKAFVLFLPNIWKQIRRNKIICFSLTQGHEFMIFTMLIVEINKIRLWRTIWYQSWIIVAFISKNTISSIYIIIKIEKVFLFGFAISADMFNSWYCFMIYCFMLCFPPPVCLPLSDKPSIEMKYKYDLKWNQHLFSW